MKRNEFKKMETKSQKELLQVAIEKKAQVDKLYGKMKAGQEKNLKKVKNLRKDIAQLLTLARQKEFEQKLKKRSNKKADEEKEE